MMYGNHPFAHLYPSEEMLRGFTLDRAKAFHSTNYGAQRAHLFVSGVFDARAVEAAIRSAFGEWAQGPAPTENPPVLASRQQVEVIDRTGSVQSSIWMGVPAADPSNPDWIRMNLPQLGSLPSLLVWGMRDWCFTPECLDRFAAVWPDAEAHRLADVGHWVVEDAPDDAHQLVESFLRRTDAHVRR
jgi:pimeloyl-ACP methyl ester carboxylesterase